MIKTSQLLYILNYDPICLCGHNESCSVCSRSQEDRNYDAMVKELALEVLKHRGIKVESTTKFGSTTYRIVKVG